MKSEVVFGSNHKMNKKVLLRKKRKRCTARSVLRPFCVLFGGLSLSWSWPGCTPILGPGWGIAHPLPKDNLTPETRGTPSTRENLAPETDQGVPPSLQKGLEIKDQ